jgi:hypothetical protein
VRYNRRMLYPVPVVVDADVLIRDVQYVITAGHLPRRIRSASGECSLFTGVSLFAMQQVLREAIRHLPDVASSGSVRAAPCSFPHSAASACSRDRRS